jgi:hypothetical protein
MSLKRTVRLALFAALLLASLAAPPLQAQPACITFEPPLALGTTYGAPVGQPSGALAFTSSGIPVRVYNFRMINGLPAFNRAYIDNAPFPFSSGQSIRTNNINLLFDLTRLPFSAKRVKLVFLDLGGYENLSVNGSPIHVGELTAAPAVLGGATVSVSSAPLPPPLGGKSGTVIIKGALRSLMIGGQELWLDQVCVE